MGLMVCVASRQSGTTPVGENVGRCVEGEVGRFGRRGMQGESKQGDGGGWEG